MHTPALTGEMVSLRPIRAQDAESAWQLYTDVEARRMIGATHVFTRDEVDDWCATVADLDGRHDWAITVGDSDEMLGELVLTGLDPHLRSGRLSMCLRSGHRGRGYAREATMLAGHFAFGNHPEGLGLHRVALEVLSINPRAFALYESLGFVLEGRLRDAHLDGERYCDTILMSMLDDEYLAAAPGWR
jgi:RimJ/RimL family protein N-acetyltransferase